MKRLLFILLLSFSFSDTYSWEDGGTILGSYGNLADVENVGPTNGITPYDGGYMLTVSESPIDGTPQAFIAWVNDISEGDEITACFYGYDTSPESAPSMRVWGSWSANDDINSYQGNANGNEEYTAGIGWDLVCHTFSTTHEHWDEGEALVVQARLYSSNSVNAPQEYFIDLVSVETTSETATIHFPDPLEGPIADAGDDQTVDAGTIIMLDGSGSYHTDGDITAYFWEQVYGTPVLLEDEESMMTTFIAPDMTETLSFDLTVYDAAGNESTDSIDITVFGSAGTLTIAQIQGQSDASPYVDQFVTTSGYVMAKNTNGFILQDAEAAWSGIWVLDFGTNASVGDEIEVSGQVLEWYDLTEIDISNGSATILSSNNTLFNPIVITETIEAYESVLVKVSGICDDLPNEYGEWSLSGITIDDYFYGSSWEDFTPVVGDEYTITGPLNYTYGLFKVNPRGDEDIQEGIIGDLNQDGTINVSDIIILINYILNNEYEPAGDLNNDQVTDILDIVLLMNVILICNGDGSDLDNDGICDGIDDCIGQYDCEGVCNGNATEDCFGECGGNADPSSCPPIPFQDIINGEYDCAGNPFTGCPLGILDCPIVNPSGKIVDYFDVTQFGGPHALIIEDAEGYRLELIIWPDNWDIANDANYAMLLEPPYNRFSIQVFSNVFEYDGEKQINVCSAENLEIIEEFSTVDVTLSVDMNLNENFNIDINSPSILLHSIDGEEIEWGGLENWFIMSDNNQDLIYEVTIPLLSNRSYEYAINSCYGSDCQNQTLNYGYESADNLQECANSDSEFGNIRYFSTENINIVLETTCWESCYACE